MQASVSRARWRAAQAGQKRAQRSKRASLHGFEPQMVAGSLRLSTAMERRLADWGARTSGVVVEIGSGAHGLIWGWPHGRLVAVDPLAAFYASEFAFLQRGDAGVTIVEARGEELPLPSASVDVVLSDNVLDHLEDPARLLLEIERVLLPGGTAFVSVDTHHRVWSVGARLYNALGDRTGHYAHVPAFPNHPFHFTMDDVEELLRLTSLQVLDRSVAPLARHGGFSSRRPYDVLKRVFFKNRRAELLLRKPDVSDRP